MRVGGRKEGRRESVVALGCEAKGSEGGGSGDQWKEDEGKKEKIGG